MRATPAWVAPAGAALAGLGGCLLVGLVDPGEPGRYPLCPFRAVTGLDCPGCGTLRAIHALTRGDVAVALDHNVVTVLLVPILVAAWVVWVLRVRDGRGAPAPPAWAGYSVAGALAAFWVVRNIPWGPLEVLASGAT